MGFLTNLQDKKLFLVGIKGTGMATLACKLAQIGVYVTGSDVPEQFATEVILRTANISWFETFTAEVIPPDCSMVIYSAAYSTNEQIEWALHHDIPLFSYPQFIAQLSQTLPTFGVAGTHGKTTASGSLDWILQKTGLSYLALYGSHLRGEITPFKLDDETICILEACEYRDHFLAYTIQGVLVVTIEHDHPDWFKDEEQTLESFKKLLFSLPAQGLVVCGTDSASSRALIDWTRVERPDLVLITYGEHPSSLLRLEYVEERAYQLQPLKGVYLTPYASIPLTLDLIGAAIFGSCILLQRDHVAFDLPQLLSNPILPALLAENSSFPGCAGRIEPLFEIDDVIYINDYAHHPSEITASIENLRGHYPEYRLVVVFFPHTVSRTQAFWQGFVDALCLADEVVMRPIAASARHDGDPTLTKTLAQQLADAIGAHYSETEDDVVATVAQVLRPGDLCVTMGAGNTHGFAQRIADWRRST